MNKDDANSRAVDSQQNLPSQVDNTTEKVLATEPNLDDIHRYFNFLGEGEQVFCGFWLGTNGDSPIRGYGVYYLNQSESLTTWRSLIVLDGSITYPTFHVTLNTMNDKGRRKSNIQACRVWCVDLDRISTKEEIQALIATYQVQLVVESSPGKYHLYWRADVSVLLNEWKVGQAGLAMMFGGDLSLMDVTHTIRVPGFPRLCKNGQPFTPRIVFDLGEEDYQRLDLGDLSDLVPGVVDLGEKGIDARRIEAQERAKLARQAAGPNGTIAHNQIGKIASSVGTGGRNQALYDCVYGYVKDTTSTDVTEELVIELGERVNRAFIEPLDTVEVEKTVRSAYAHGIEAREARERKIREATNKLGAVSSTVSSTVTGTSNGTRPVSTTDTNSKSGDATSRSANGFIYDYSSGALAQNRFTEKAVAERVLQRFAGKVLDTGTALYAFEECRKIWLSQERDKAVLYDYVRQCCDDTMQDSEFVRELCLDGRGNLVPDKIKQWQRHFSSFHVYHSVLGIIENRGDLPRIEISQFDAHQNLLYCANGVVDLVKAEIRDALPDDYLLHKSRVTWVKDATCPWWEQFIEEIFAFNSEPDKMCLFIQELFGYSLSGSIAEQKIFIHYGGGANGKSKLLWALGILLGEYSALMGGSALAKKKNVIEQELQRVGVKAEGKRCLVIDDVDTKAQWNESIVKNFTGPKLPVRKLYEEERDIPNRAKFHLGCNEAPEPESENYGILRRLCIVPYPRTFEQDPKKEQEILEKIEEEKSGILNWAIQGYQRVVKNGGITYPREVLASVEEYREEHFSLESLFLSLVAVSDKNPISDEDWHPISTILDEANYRINEQGLNTKITTDRLGRFLKQRMRAEVKRVLLGNTKVRFYHVQLLFTPKNTLNTKIEQ